MAYFSKNTCILNIIFVYLRCHSVMKKLSPILFTLPIDHIGQPDDLCVQYGHFL